MANVGEWVEKAEADWKGAVALNRRRRDPLLGALASLIKALDPHSVLTRYPGASATVTEAKDALAVVRTARRVLRKRLGL